ncbi:MAG: glycosyltransferase family 4 protein [Chloroflexaceae bacterium]|nr:glycosyltransferase family 4 protein [Chloroflexaceae bacterium]
MPKPRILFLVNESWYFWAHRLHIARAARDAGYQVIVAAAPHEVQQQIEAEGFWFYPLRLPRKVSHPWQELVALLDIISIYRLARPDLVHQVTIKPVLYGSLAAKITGIPAIVNAVTGLGFVFLPGGWRRRLFRTVIEWSYRLLLTGKRIKVIFENPDDRDLFIQRRMIAASQAFVLPGSGVDAHTFTPSAEPEGDPVVLLASRLLWDKGVGELVDAARILKQRGVTARVVLAGTPDTSNPATIPESQLIAWTEEGVVEWIGYQANMPAVLAQCHIVCLPSSYREGIPMSLIEAASCSRPIVTTDAPGCREIVRDQWNGLLVPVKDAQAVANALETLIQNPSLRRQMGERGRQLVLERFTKEHVIEQTFAIYRSLVGEGWPA